MHRSLTSRAPTLGHRNDVGGTLGMSGRALGAEHEGWILTLLGMTGKIAKEKVRGRSSGEGSWRPVLCLP